MLTMDNIVLSVLAHPDDAEFLCAGAMIRLVREHGWKAHIASMTPGDCGSAELPADWLLRSESGTSSSRRRRKRPRAFFISL